MADRSFRAAARGLPKAAKTTNIRQASAATAGRAAERAAKAARKASEKATKDDARGRDA